MPAYMQTAYNAVIYVCAHIIIHAKQMAHPLRTTSVTYTQACMPTRNTHFTQSSVITSANQLWYEHHDVSNQCKHIINSQRTSLQLAQLMT